MPNLPSVGSETRFVVFSTNRPEVIERFANVKVHHTTWGEFAAALTPEQISILASQPLPTGMWISFKGVQLYAPSLREEQTVNEALTSRRGCRIVYDPTREGYNDHDYYDARITETLSFEELVDACYGGNVPATSIQF